MTSTAARQGSLKSGTGSEGPSRWAGRALRGGGRTDDLADGQICQGSVSGEGSGSTTGGAPAPASGLRAQMVASISALSSLVGRLEPECLEGSDAKELYASVARLERLCFGAKALLARRVDSSLVWKQEGHRDAASLLSELEGVPTGQARSTVKLSHQLVELPGTEEAVRDGRLSRSKAVELVGAAEDDPASEDTLLAGAEHQDFATVQERCRQARARRSDIDPMAATRKAHANRSFASWFDADGFHFKGSDTTERGAKLQAAINSVATYLRREARRIGLPEGSEPHRALAADALFALVTTSGDRSGSGTTAPEVDPDIDPGTEFAEPEDNDETGGSNTPSGAGGSRCTPSDRTSPDPTDGGDSLDISSIVNRPPSCAVTVVVDLTTLVTGTVRKEGVCEIEEVGPVPPQLARSLMSDCFLRFLVTGEDGIHTVCHPGRTINARLRTALAFRDRMRCVVPGCRVGHRLEIDHTLPVEDGGMTELDNLSLLCHWHHHLKTTEKWVLTRSKDSGRDHPVWSFTPPPAFGQESDLGFDTEEARAARQQATSSGNRGEGSDGRSQQLSFA
jgi:hypothetical protein